MVFSSFMADGLILTIRLLGGTAGSIVMGKARNPLPHLRPGSGKGIVLSLAAGSLLSLSFFIFSKVSREVGPFVAGYFWESAVGCFAALFIALRRSLTGRSIERVSGADFRRIFLFSAPTLLGTGAAGLAFTLGPFGIMRAISSASILITVLLGFLFFAEKLTRAQWVGIGMVILGIMALRLMA